MLTGNLFWQPNVTLPWPCRFQTVDGALHPQRIAASMVHIWRASATLLTLQDGAFPPVKKRKDLSSRSVSSIICLH